MPRLRARAVHFDAREAHGAIWVKSAQSFPEFPRFDTAGFYHLGNLSGIADAPLELVLDNLTEVEHTPTTHRLFGYDLECMEQVHVQFEPADTQVRTLNDGPSRRLPLAIRLLLGIRNNFHFHDEWTVFFSPVYAVFDHYWKHPATSQEGKVRWRVYVFLVPLDPARTLMQVFTYMKCTYPGSKRGLRLLWPLIIRRLSDYEMRQDVSLVDNLADKSPHLQGMKLSRFDRGLSLNRERIDRIYRANRSGVT
jgi:vanillate O-demethylase monooxygenase subunit